MDPFFGDRTLRRYLAGALEPPRAEEVEAALAADPALRERLALLRATTVQASLDPWRVPPPGLWLPGAPATEVRLALTLGEEPGPGDLVELRVALPEGTEDHLVIVLNRAGGDWTVWFPARPEEEIRAGELPREPDGRARLDLALEQGGRQRLALVLLPPELAVAWEEPEVARWEPVRDAVASGRAPVITLEV